MVIGMGQYPNLATQDAFACVCSNGKQRVLRASRELGDRMDTTVGPFRVEVIEPLHKVRVIGESSEHPLAFDLTWTGAIPAFEEPQHFVRSHGRVMFDSHRFAQTGFWEGTIEVDGEHDHRHPRPVEGNARPLVGRAARRRGGAAPASAARRRRCRACGTTRRCSSTTTRSSTSCRRSPTATARSRRSGAHLERPARGYEWLGRPEFEHTLEPGTRMIRKPSKLSFPQAPGGGFDVAVTPLRHAYIAIGTGYGMEDDWRHGMYQGPLVVQYNEYDAGGARVVGLVRRRRPRRALRDEHRRRRVRPARARLLRPVPQVRAAR